MIKKYNDFINESLLDKMKGKDKVELMISYGFEYYETPEEFLDYIFNLNFDIKSNIIEDTYILNDIIYFQIQKRSLNMKLSSRIYTVLWNVYNLNYAIFDEFIKQKIKEKLNININYIFKAVSF